MRIGIDMLYAQSPAALHGIGNYSFSHILHLAHHPEVDVYYYEPIYDGLSERAYATQLARFILDYELDFFHFPSPMQVPFPDLIARGELPFVRTTALVHDIIPLVYPEHHLSTEEARIEYEQKLVMLRNMHHLFTNSEHTRQDLLKIGFPAEDVTALSAGCDDGFYQLRTAQLDDLKHRFAVDQPFILAFTPWDFRKNAERLIQAFGYATRGRPEFWQIVFVNDTPSEEVRQRLDRIAQAYGAGGRIRYAGRVTKSQLLRLYHCARAVALPTLYEGFGLPALEGMQCGTPVLTSNTSSMPEVVGQAGVQVDPLDVRDIERGLRKVLFDKAFRKQLSAEGSRRAQMFQWRDVAERTVGVCRRLLASEKTEPTEHSTPRLHVEIRRLRNEMKVTQNEIYQSLVKLKHAVEQVQARISEVQEAIRAGQHPPVWIEMGIPQSSRWLLNPADWHGYEPVLRWSSAHRAGVLLEKANSHKTLVVEAENGFPKSFECTVYVNNVRVGSMKFAKPDRKTFHFHVNQIPIGTAKVEFEVQHLWIPAKHSKSDDGRQLGIGIKSVGFSEDVTQ